MAGRLEGTGLWEGYVELGALVVAGGALKFYRCTGQNSTDTSAPVGV